MQSGVCAQFGMPHGSDHTLFLDLTQEQMFQLWLRDPASSAYNSGFTAVLEGPLDMAALQAAAQLVFVRQQVSMAC